MLETKDLEMISGLLDKKFETFEERMDQKMDKRFECFGKQIREEMDDKLHESENMILEQLDCVQMKLMDRIDSLQQDVNELKTYYRIDRLEKDTIVLQREQLDNLEKRVARLEMKMA